MTEKNVKNLTNSELDKEMEKLISIRESEEKMGGHEFAFTPSESFVSYENEVWEELTIRGMAVDMPF